VSVSLQLLRRLNPEQCLAFESHSNGALSRIARCAMRNSTVTRVCTFRNSEQVERLAREFAQLDWVDQARVVASAERLRREALVGRKLEIPILQGGSRWIGGDSSREVIYGDDGR